MRATLAACESQGDTHRWKEKWPKVAIRWSAVGHDQNRSEIPYLRSRFYTALVQCRLCRMEAQSQATAWRQGFTIPPSGF